VADLDSKAIVPQEEPPLDYQEQLLQLDHPKQSPQQILATYQ